MKKLISLLAMMLFLLSLSCYIFDYSGNSRIAIRLGSFPAGIKTLHMAVYNGYPASDNLLMTSKLTNGAYAEIEVPPGTDRFFVFAAENYDGLIEYINTLASLVPYDIKDGETINVLVSMEYITIPFTSDRFNLYYSCSDVLYSWNSIPGATSYSLWANPDETPSGEPIYLLRYTGTYPFVYRDTESYDFVVNAYFEAFGLNTVMSLSIGGGC